MVVLTKPKLNFCYKLLVILCKVVGNDYRHIGIDLIYLFIVLVFTISYAVFVLFIVFSNSPSFYLQDKVAEIKKLESKAEEAKKRQRQAEERFE